MKNMGNIEEKKVLDDLDKVIDGKGLSRMDKWNKYLADFFERIALMNQSDEAKGEISKSVVEDANVGVLYWMQIVLSALIATFGLLQNSVAVVIGAMLIAPLFIPLQALAFAITEGKTALFWRALWTIIISSLVSVVIAIGIVWMVPLKVETSEILARVSPNIFDLFIAGFSAVIALLALVFKRLSQSVAGVAMAAALMPPLAVIGIQIGFENVDKAFGALLLYSTNIVAIVLVGVLMFILYGFHPHKDKSYSVITQGVILLFVTLLLSVPLVTSIQAEQEKVALYNDVSNSLDLALDTVIPEGSVSELVVNSEEGDVFVSLDLRLPEEVSLFEADLQKFTDLVSDNLGREVELNLDIIRTASLTKVVDTKVQLVSDIEAYLEGDFVSGFEDKVLIDYELKGIGDNRFDVRLVYAIEDGDDFSSEEKERLMEDLSVAFEEQDFELSWVALNPALDSDDVVVDIEEEIREFMEDNLSKGWYVLRTEVNKLEASEGDLYDVSVWLSLPNSIKDQLSDNVVVTSELERAIQLYKATKFTGSNEDKFTFSYEFSFRDPSIRVGGLE